MTGYWAVGPALLEGWEAFGRILSGCDLRVLVPTQDSGSWSLENHHPEMICQFFLPCKKGVRTLA